MPSRLTTGLLSQLADRASCRRDALTLIRSHGVEAARVITVDSEGSGADEVLFVTSRAKPRIAFVRAIPAKNGHTISVAAVDGWPL